MGRMGRRPRAKSGVPQASRFSRTVATGFVEGVVGGSGGRSMGGGGRGLGPGSLPGFVFFCYYSLNY